MSFSFKIPPGGKSIRARLRLRAFSNTWLEISSHHGPSSYTYRQASLAISKRYISKLVEKRNYYYPTSADDPIRMFAAGAGHHPRMLLTAYAIDKALPSRLQPELLEMYYRLSAMWQDWNVQYYRDNCQPQDKEPCKSLNVTLHTWKRASSPESPERAPKRVKTALGGENTNDLSDGFLYNCQYQILICITCGSMVQPVWALSLFSIVHTEPKGCPDSRFTSI
jgi:hypothetical protein